MGFRLTDTGLKIVLTKRIPDLIREHAVPDLVEFLATVLAVLDRFLRRRGFRAGERAMSVAFGPGLGSEMLLLEA